MSSHRGSGKLRNKAAEIDVCSFFAVRSVISLFSHLLLISYPSNARAEEEFRRQWIFPGSMCFEISEQVSVCLTDWREYVKESLKEWQESVIDRLTQLLQQISCKFFPVSQEITVSKHSRNVREEDFAWSLRTSKYLPSFDVLIRALRHLAGALQCPDC